MSKNSIIILFTTLVLLVLASIVALYYSTSETTDTYSFGYQPFGNNLPFFVAVENGYFADEGVSVQPTRLISANDAANAVVQGELIGNATVPLNVLLNIEERQPGEFNIFMVKTTSRHQWSDYLLVAHNSTIQSLSQLANKKVGAYPGSAQQAILRLILQEFVPPDQITTVELPPSTQLQALSSGQVDALLTYDELAIRALDQNIAKVLEKNPIGKHVVDPCYGFPYVLSSDFVSQHPTDARAVREAMYRAVDFIRMNESQSREIMSQWVGTEPHIASKVRLWDQTKAEDIDINAMQKLADIFYRTGITSKQVNIEPLIWTPTDTQHDG